MAKKTARLFAKNFTSSRFLIYFNVKQTRLDNDEAKKPETV
jgi:hypothetical protein